MKYLYKQTGVVVESSVELDPAVFKPVTEPEEETVSQEPVEQEEPDKQEPPEEKKPVKTTVKRTTARTKK